MSSSSSTVTSMPYLRTSREFSQNTEELVKTLSKMYFEISQAVNRRTIGTYITSQSVNGELYYSTNSPTSGMPEQYRQVYRKVFVRSSLAAPATDTFNHGVTGIIQVTRLYGNAITAGVVNGKYIPIPFASTVNINQSVSISANDTQITVINGAGADAITSYVIVFEYTLS